ncbi:Uncharacterised protein [Mycobacterium tuberculosis]|nr:Uncharacterised protein [Mycobacterium tuberculosis]
MKNTSLNSESPVICRSGRTSTPGANMSMITVVMPACLGASGSVRTVARPRAQYCAPLVHTFCPLIFQPPSTRVARVLTEAASDPASGSENSWHHISCWRSAFSTNLSICQGVPC